MNNMENFNTDILNNLDSEFAKKIIKDFKLPFSYINGAHFNDMISHIPNVAPEFHTALEVMVDICTKVSMHNQAKVMSLIRTTMDDMVDEILNAPGYITFNGQNAACNNAKITIETLFPIKQNQIPTGDNYNRESSGKNFISIDLKNAAFQALKVWDKLYGNQYGYILGIGISSYEDFVRHTMDIHPMDPSYSKEIEEVAYNYICKCKALRQVIFGKTNPKRIMHIEKYIMQTIVTLIEDRFGVLPVRFNNDELVYDYNPAMDEAFYNKDILTSLKWNVQFESITTEVEVPMDFHKNIYTLEEVSMFQRTNMLPLEKTKHVKFYIKHMFEFLFHTPLVPEFKSLPSNLYLIGRALYNSNQEEARFFEQQPVMIDGVFHWTSFPGVGQYENIWELAD